MSTQTMAPDTGTAASLQHRSATVGSSSWDEASRSATVVIASETPVRMFSNRDEVLLVSGVRHAALLPLLDSHNRYSLSDHIGSIRNIRADGPLLLADLHVADTPQGDLAAKLISGGHLTDVSVGYSVTRKVEIPKGNVETIEGRAFEGPLSVVTEWRLMEVSAVSIGADPLAKVRQAEQEQEQERSQTDPATKGPEEAAHMADPTTPQEPPVTPAPDLAALRQQAIDTENHRIEMIRGLGRASGADQALVDDCIRKGHSLEQAGQIFVEEHGRRHTAPPVSITVTRDSHETLCRGIEAGIQLRAGLPVAKEDQEIARQYAGASISDLCREFLTSKGETRLPFDKDSLFRMAFSGRNRPRLALSAHTQARALSTSDFPALLANVANKALATAYAEQPSTYQAFTRLVSIPDFKPRSVAQLSAVGDLELVPEGAQITNTSLSDRSESYAIGTYSKIIPLTRQALINDDLSAFTRLPVQAGSAARRTVNKSVYAILNNGQTSAWNMSDGNPLFDASNHFNYGTTGTALSATTLNTAIAAMMTQRGLIGEIINVEPAYLLVPPSLKQTAEELLYSSAKVSATFSSGVVNTLQNVVTLIVDGNMDTVGGGSATAWYLAARPSFIDTIEVGFLNGIDSPTLEEQDDFDSFGTRWRVFIDFGVKPIDWRGLVKRSGAS